MQLLIARTARVEREINYVWTYIVKFMKWMQGSIKIINFLDQLKQGLTWADRNVLSPLIIPTRSLREMLVYVAAHLEENTMLKLIPVMVNEIHEMVSFYMVAIKGTLLVVLDIPLTSYPGTYIVRPTAMVASVERLDTHFLYLRKVPHYFIRCHLPCITTNWWSVTG